MGLGGALIAFEYCGEEANLIGVGGAYAFTHSHEEGGAGRANLNQGYLTAYGTVARDNWYLDLALWGGYYSANNRRRISFPGVDETARSRIQGWQIAPHIEAGYCGFKWKKCHADWFNSDAFVMGDFVVNSEGSFKERGANEFDMGQKKRSCSFFRGETGLRFYEVLECNWGSLVLKEKGSYAYQKAFQTGIITAYLLGSPGSFTVATLTGAQNLGVAEFSTLFIPTGSKAPYVDIRYQGEFGSRYQSHQGMVEMGKDF